jgi:hypothetical protein
LGAQAPSSRLNNVASATALYRTSLLIDPFSL